MGPDRAYYFIRANGGTWHANPDKPECYVEGEPAPPAKGYFNHIPYCLREGIARIGWPDTGDLRLPPKADALAQCYELSTLPEHIQKYLLQFRDIAVGSIVLVPDIDHSGNLIIGEVTREYHYFHRPPEHAYENAHRIGVRWDRRGEEVIIYKTKEIGLKNKGGFWTRAFHHIDTTQRRELVSRIDALRKSRLPGGNHA